MNNAEDDLPPLTNPEVLSTNISSDFSSKQVNVCLDDTNYLLWKHQVKEIYDTLTACGSSVQEIEHIATILNGLPHEYNPFVAVITSSQESYALNRVISVLMDAVSRIYALLQLFPAINTTQVLSFPSNIVQPKTSQFYNPGTSSTTLQSPGKVSV
ncbi:hypothetical protein PVK06_030045 [Gossypium arboreum]|uniref:Uncharacterized protein n=1 Tax=Gossypium arboreum TaxID=29729 RepID=A0ABR0NM88_GOSAR|nr:hypothetical protein PVK06_030045 [Gossypium arboreum]